ncbi:MAG TPA: methyltransferase domain-containing protein [Blastocatellia bacterium]|jgi:cyclopropane fatty-acyl-phospholipid synthase-like methyltransferase
MVSTHSQEIRAAEIARKNREIYDETSDPVWRLAVYQPLHGGWEFINLGGQWLLDTFAAQAMLGPDKSILELCSGQGATCRYLAERFECRVTGVEMNPRQVEQARARLKEVSPQVARRVELVEANILCWNPERVYDAVYTIDSLMLVDDIQGALSKAYASLRPGALLMIAVILAGPHIDERMRRFAWEVDGMISLLAPSNYRHLLSSAGFREIDCRDITARAIDSSELIASALDQNRGAIVDLQGEEVYRGWLDVGEVYLAGFRSGKLSYYLITARRDDR